MINHHYNRGHPHINKQGFINPGSTLVKKLGCLQPENEPNQKTTCQHPPGSWLTTMRANPNVCVGFSVEAPCLGQKNPYSKRDVDLGFFRTVLIRRGSPLAKERFISSGNQEIPTKNPAATRLTPPQAQLPHPPLPPPGPLLPPQLHRQRGGGHRPRPGHQLVQPRLRDAPATPRTTHHSHATLTRTNERAPDRSTMKGTQGYMHVFLGKPPVKKTKAETNVCCLLQRAENQGRRWDFFVFRGVATFSLCLQCAGQASRGMSS